MSSTARILEPDQLRGELKQGRFAPVYLLAGADTFRSERTARWMRERVVGADTGGLNAESAWADETTPARIAEAASAYPMFGGKRFLWVRHAEALPAGAAIEPLLRYLENPADCTVLVLTSSKLDKRLKFTSACAARGCVVEFAPLRGAALESQLERQAQTHGLRLHPAAVRLLVDLVGEDLAELDQELAKLALQPEAAEPGTVLGERTVRLLVGRSRDVDAFELANALDPDQTISLLHGWAEMRRRGGDVFGTGAILGWRLRQLAQLCEALEAGWDARDAGQLAGIPPWQARTLIPMAHNVPSALLHKALEEFRQADRRAKSSSLGAELAYDLAVAAWAARCSDDTRPRNRSGRSA